MDETRNTARGADVAADSSDERRSPEAAKRVSFLDLASGGREVLIVHQDQTYRLRLTRNQKLILTK